MMINNPAVDWPKQILGPKCGKAIVVKRGRNAHRWSCALPAGHDGEHARVRLKVWTFDERGPRCSTEVDTCVPLEEYERAKRRKEAPDAAD